MKTKDKIVFVTGGANGIGRGLCERFHAEGVEKIIVTDIDEITANVVAKEVDGVAYKLNVAEESEVQTVVADVLDKFGRIDVVISNAGIGGDEGCLEVSNESWQNIWEINVLSHLYLSRAVFPSMLERGVGYFLITASAAGLLTYPTAAPYSVTKHAAVAFAEYLAYSYMDKGITVSCLCPQGVKTNLIATKEGEPENFLMAEAITVEECAEAVILAMENETFLILPHKEVAEYIVKKVSSYDKWLSWMSGLRNKILTKDRMAKIDQIDDFHPLSRREWRAWLAENYDKLQGIWFVYYKKHTKKLIVTYEEAVEEALCFGWIDSIPRKLDDERSKLLYTPRKPKSVWSKPNKERVERLIESGLMSEIGLKKIDQAKLDGSWDALNASDNLEIQEDLLQAFEANNIVFENFDKFTNSVKKSILSWIYSAKTLETRAKRINETVSMANKNLRSRFDKNK